MSNVHDREIFCGNARHVVSFNEAYGDFFVRLSKREDLSDLERLERFAFPFERYGDDVITRRKFRYIHKKANALILVCEDFKKEICGYIILFFKKNISLSRVYSLCVDAGHRGQGVGKMLMVSAEKICSVIKIQKLSLETREDNGAMQALAAGCGFKKTRRMDGYYADGVAALKFVKTLI